MNIAVLLPLFFVGLRIPLVTCASLTKDVFGTQQVQRHIRDRREDTNFIIRYLDSSYDDATQDDTSNNPYEDDDDDDDDDEYDNNDDEDDKDDKVVSAKAIDNKYPAVEAVTIRIIDNWGNPDFTCLYRIRLHGRVMH
mmetsp:Transcript_13790/g.16235  ORF Transcript_13790/g.16235 Transcript_13790/m.16235 type:complete len:138 (-) Transcript_13790:251-664(-)